MDPHPIEQNIQALNDGEHNLKLHAPCSIIRCVPCLVQCIGTAIQGSFLGDSTGCDVMGFYSAFATTRTAAPASRWDDVGGAGREG